MQTLADGRKLKECDSLSLIVEANHLITNFAHVFVLPTTYVPETCQKRFH